jgi:hypothetical protein
VRTSSFWVVVSVRVAAALMLVSLVVSVDLNSCMRVFLHVSLNNALGINSTYYVMLKLS